MTARDSNETVQCPATAERPRPNPPIPDQARGRTPSSVICITRYDESACRSWCAGCVAHHPEFADGFPPVRRPTTALAPSGPPNRDLASVTPVTARTPSQPVRPAPLTAIGRSTLPSRLWTAVGVAVVAGLLLAVGPLLPVIPPGTPGYTSGPLLAVLGILPAGVAVLLALRGSSSAVGGVLSAAALFAPGRALVDAQLAIQANASVARPEFAAPTTIESMHAGTGLWLLLAGHVLTLVAGALVLGATNSGDPAGETTDRRPGSYRAPRCSPWASAPWPPSPWSPSRSRPAPRSCWPRVPWTRPPCSLSAAS